MKAQMAAATALAPSSAELVGRIRARDDSVWHDLIDQYEPVLRRLARLHGLSAEDAADVVQLTWLRCLEHFDQLNDPDRLLGWLCTICRRESIQLASRKRRELMLTELDTAQLTDDRDGQQDPGTEVARRDEHDRLRLAITALPDRQRTVLVELLKREHQSYLDLSRRLGLPVGSIGPTWHRALVRLRHDPRLADGSGRLGEAGAGEDGGVAGGRQAGGAGVFQGELAHEHAH